MSLIIYDHLRIHANLFHSPIILKELHQFFRARNLRRAQYGVPNRFEIGVLGADHNGSLPTSFSEYTPIPELDTKKAGNSSVNDFKTSWQI